MNLAQSNTSFRYFQLGLFAFVILSHYPYFSDLHIYVAEWDPVARIRIALQHTSQTPLIEYFFPSSVWLPLHFYFIRFVNWFTAVPEVLIYINMVFTALSFNILFHLANPVREWNRMIISFFVLSVLSLNHITYYIAQTALTEPIVFILISLSALLYETYAKNTKDTKALTLLIITLVMTMMMRYECWLIAGIYFIFIMIQNPSPQKIWKLSFALALFPLIWILFNLYDTGHSLYGYTAIEEDASDHFNLTTFDLKQIYAQTFEKSFWLFLTFSTFLLFKLRQQLNRLYIVAFFVVTLFFFGLFLTQKLEPFPRYSYFSVIFFILICMDYIRKIKVSFNKRSVFALASFLLLSILALEKAKDRPIYFELLPHRAEFETAIEEIGKILDRDRNSDHRLFVVRDALIPDMVAIRLKLFTERSHRHFFTVQDEFWRQETQKTWDVYEEMKLFDDQSIHYLVLPKISDTGRPPEHERFWPQKVSRQFTPIFENKALTIYERIHD